MTSEHQQPRAPRTQARGAQAAAHLAGALLAKMLPPTVQVLLLAWVAREDGLTEVALLALGSAASFGSGSLAEAGFMTSLSAPRAFYGTEHPPLRGTRAMRWSLALAGSALYSGLWALGMGEHDLRLLLLAPLPAVLAISYGYSAVMNASGDLSREGRISVAEALACLALTLLLTLVMSALAAACLALLLSRGLGLMSRSIALRRYPTDSTRSLPSVLRTQRWFLFSTALVVFHGQADLLALGFAGGLGLVAVYGPLLRTTYSTLLIAEALSWMLFGRFGDDIVDAAQPHSRRGLLGDWRRVGLAVGIGIAVVFSVVAEPFLELLLAEPLEGMALPVLLLSVLIVVRFWTFVQGVQLTRAGVQRERIPALAVGGVIVLSAALLVGGASIPTAIAVLTGARLLSETVVCAWYTKLARSLPARAALR